MQEYVLKPLMLTISLIPIASLLKQHGMAYHLHVEDTQLFQAFELSENPTSSTIAYSYEENGTMCLQYTTVDEKQQGETQ